MFKQTADGRRQTTGGRQSAVGGPLLPDSSFPSPLLPYFAVPFGDMMIAGCFGLLAATADLLPELGETVHASLRGAGGSGTPPWEIA